MLHTQNIAEDITWIGASDRRLALFENLFPIPNGVSYNSYLVLDEKTVLFDTADVSVADQFLENLRGTLGDRKLDYFVVLHMEPDHCAQINKVLALYPEATVVGGMQTFKFMEQFFPETANLNKLTVKEGDTLCSGKHTFHFVSAPMVHWPEVLFAYDEMTKALFCADAFGTFGALDEGVFEDSYNFEQRFLADARRYYANIVGKYGPQVQAVLKKAAGLEIGMLCPLHGPIWRDAEHIGWLLEKYQKWSTYEAEDDETIVIYGSLYGHTASAAETAAQMIREKSGKPVHVYDASKTHESYLIGEIWRVKRIVIFCPTYNNGIYLPIAALLHDMQALTVQNRKFAVAQNGTWAPASGKLIVEELGKLKNCEISENMLTIKSALHAADQEALEAFVDAALA